MSHEVIIETRNLTKVYRDFWGRPKVQALKALDLQVHRGEIFGLLGPNGSGKTTTIKLLLGLLFATEGEALIFNEPTTNVSKNERIGYLPDEHDIVARSHAGFPSPENCVQFPFTPESVPALHDAMLRVIDRCHDSKWADPGARARRQRFCPGSVMSRPSSSCDSAKGQASSIS